MSAEEREHGQVKHSPRDSLYLWIQADGLSDGHATCGGFSSVWTLAVCCVTLLVWFTDIFKNIETIDIQLTAIMHVFRETPMKRHGYTPTMLYPVNKKYKIRLHELLYKVKQTVSLDLYTYISLQ